jgi:general secretion pathway protein A
MYERFYGLRERPFALSPDPDYLYPSRIHREALSYLRYGIEGRAGFVVLTGEIGCGKTTMLQTVLRGLDRQTAVSRLVNTRLDARELIEAIMLDFGLEPSATQSKPHLLRELARFLVEQRSARRLALLVVDEAQNLGPAALEEVRMLSNLETEKSKLIQIILVGQPDLRRLLAQPELEQLRQRVTVSYHIQPLDADDTFAYINHRLKRAAIGTPLEFSRDVTDFIHLHSGGVGRKINVIADAILLYGYGEGQQVIDVDLAQDVLQELESTGLVGTSASATASGSRTPALAADSANASFERELKAREARIREQQERMEKQQALLAEGYRLLRAQREQQVAPAAEPAVTRSQEPGPTVQTAAAAAQGPLISPSYRIFREQQQPNDLWSRVRLNLFGPPRPAFEE